MSKAKATSCITIACSGSFNFLPKRYMNNGQWVLVTTSLIDYQGCSFSFTFFSLFLFFKTGRFLLPDKEPKAQKFALKKPKSHLPIATKICCQKKVICPAKNPLLCCDK